MNVTHPIHVNMEIVSTPLGVSSALAIQDLQILIVARTSMNVPLPIHVNMEIVPTLLGVFSALVIQDSRIHTVARILTNVSHFLVHTARVTTVWAHIAANAIVDGLVLIVILISMNAWFSHLFVVMETVLIQQGHFLAVASRDGPEVLAKKISMSAVPQHVRIMEYVSICRGIFFAIVLMDFPAICAKVMLMNVCYILAKTVEFARTFKEATFVIVISKESTLGYNVKQS